MLGSPSNDEMILHDANGNLFKYVVKQGRIKKEAQTSTNKSQHGSRLFHLPFTHSKREGQENIQDLSYLGTLNPDVAEMILMRVNPKDVKGLCQSSPVLESVCRDQELS